MKNTFAIVAAAALPLILSTTGAVASEQQFRTPATDRAQQTKPLLDGAAHALEAGAFRHLARTGEENISNLWLFPTADEDTVFAQYIVTTNQPSSKVASEEHLELLRMKGDRIVEQRDLTRAPDDSELRAEQLSGRRDWSASIGNGHTTSTTETSATSEGSPASPHWSASIGTGQVSDGETESLHTATSASASQAPSAHWTAKIGTARAVDSSKSAQKGRFAS